MGGNILFIKPLVFICGGWVVGALYHLTTVTDDDPKLTELSCKMMSPLGERLRRLRGWPTQTPDLESPPGTLSTVFSQGWELASCSPPSSSYTPQSFSLSASLYMKGHTSWKRAMIT